MGISKKMIPIGIEDFGELRAKNYYYIDKTALIKELLMNQAKVTLFTRPRRFGKSLNMSMLYHFFSLSGDKHLFDGLKISNETELCEKYMGKYPVIFLSLKDIDASNDETAYQMMVHLIMNIAEKFYFLLDSKNLNDKNRESYRDLLDKQMEEGTLRGSLKTLCELLEKHFGTKVILLIDEYDVPLAKAHANGYYDRMVSLIRNLLGAALKTNASLEFAVLTGCLRISKESIFTGLNNLKVRSITDVRFDDYFGFTDEEVLNLLSYYGYPDNYVAAKKWYDGYRFGKTEVYCPWDVLNYCDSLLDDPTAQPEDYWINTSSNDAVKYLIRKSDSSTIKRDVENLVAGEIITKEIRQELTYPEIYQTTENIWSLLFMTGYLTQRGEPDGRRLRLAIPNLEVRDVFVTQIMEYFDQTVRSDKNTLDLFCNALKNGDSGTVEDLFTKYLRKMVSIRDTASKNDLKENFYHGVLLGILGVKETWDVFSNREAGDGYADILVRPDDENIGIVIEMKYARDRNLDAACGEALRQIERTGYKAFFEDEGVNTILKYGMSCYKKRCRVMLAERKFFSEK